MYKIALFDMDGTLLQGRTIFHLASRLGFMDELQHHINSSLEPFERTIAIAKLLKGVRRNEIITIYREIPYRPHVQELIDSLKKKDIILAIASDSYDIVANDVKNRLGFDYSFANNLLFYDSICTGKVILHNKTQLRDKITNRIYSISKSRVLRQLCKKHQINLKESIAIGDSLVDCGMLSIAGLGVAVFTSLEIQKYADIVTEDLMDILTYIGR